MNPLAYFDTSALAKWYLREARSDEVEAYIRANGPVAISDLTVVEMRSLLASHRRESGGNEPLTVDKKATQLVKLDVRVRGAVVW